MGLRNKAIASLFNGVSQQPAALRLDSQCELMDNAHALLSDGVIKRAPLTHAFRNAFAGFDNNVAIHLIDRGPGKRFALYAGNSILRVVNLQTGAVATPSGGMDYLASDNPRRDFKFLTVADYTFVLNTARVTQMAAPGPIIKSNYAYVYAKKGVAQTDYSVWLDGTWVTYTTGDTTAALSYRTNVIASELFNRIKTVPGFNASLKGSSIQIWREDGADFGFATTDSWGELALVGIKGNVQKFSDMPAKFFQGDTIEVTGDPDTDLDSYYVRWVDADGKNSGSYLETTAKYIVNNMLPGSMPYQLIPNADSSAWSFQPTRWANRSVGDETSAPPPSFIGHTIQDIFFFRDRLGFLSGENVILSRAGDYFNFWPETVTNILDSDPIDIAATHTEISLLKNAVPFNETLLLFSDYSQFVLTSDTLLTPKTATVTQTTSFASSPDCRPVSAGQNVFFVSEHGEYSGIKEYFVEASTLTKDAAEITSHVPHYLPKGIFQLAANTNEDLIIAASSETPNVLYLYKYFWSGEDKVQSAWYTWTFDPLVQIKGISFIGTKLYVFSNRGESYHIETIDLQSNLLDANLGALVHLDHRETVIGEYDAHRDVTIYKLSFEDTTGFIGVLNDTKVGVPGEVIKATTRFPREAYTLLVDGDYRDGQVITGLPYTMRYQFSEQFIRDSNKNVVSGRLQLRSFLVRYTNTGYLKALVTPAFRDTNETVLTGMRLGTGALKLGRPAIDSGVFKFPILANAQGVTIELQNDSHLPCALQSAEWLGDFTTKGQRV